MPPQGDTASRPSSCPPGSLRFNTDSSHLEYYKGDTIGWVEVEAELTAPLGTSTTGVGHRGIIVAGGLSSPSNMDNIGFITISTLGDAQDFGNLSQARYKLYSAGCASRTRALWGGGYTQPGQNRDTIDFVTFPTTGDATDFGNLLAVSYTHLTLPTIYSV